jgi:hypothetical protein
MSARLGFVMQWPDWRSLLLLGFTKPSDDYVENASRHLHLSMLTDLGFHIGGGRSMESDRGGARLRTVDQEGSEEPEHGYRGTNRCMQVRSKAAFDRVDSSQASTPLETRLRPVSECNASSA